MTVIHIVLFKFRADVSIQIREKCVSELKTLKRLPCVLNGRLTVGGPSITNPIERSKGYHYALVSYHKDRTALEEYQASKEHYEVTSAHLWPYKEDITRFDFEVDDESDGLDPRQLLGATIPNST
ncbi:stress responsive A/B barrel domain protein [Pseudovirgaria hyperparasitica]|uniref:Stress responsive A/B barrel domain protein n=1 Tax=Pseudovirgaria hyperparasitica TaxID=470096 RepID=A0A6A6WLJ3_9PEZI|nr:stress responsive A/B barrel domain protein [Pseudovirgaria hyperparasitica]KAF2763016.1 stress responsive A/B barrel domain protein [Pseudovirgaria hyperparasitica]